MITSHHNKVMDRPRPSKTVNFDDREYVRRITPLGKRYLKNSARATGKLNSLLPLNVSKEDTSLFADGSQSLAMTRVLDRPSNKTNQEDLTFTAESSIDGVTKVPNFISLLPVIPLIRREPVAPTKEAGIVDGDLITTEGFTLSRANSPDTISSSQSILVESVRYSLVEPSANSGIRESMKGRPSSAPSPKPKSILKKRQVLLRELSNVSEGSHISGYASAFKRKGAFHIDPTLLKHFAALELKTARKAISRIPQSRSSISRREKAKTKSPATSNEALHSIPIKIDSFKQEKSIEFVRKKQDAYETEQQRAEQEQRYYYYQFLIQNNQYPYKNPYTRYSEKEVPREATITPNLKIHDEPVAVLVKPTVPYSKTPLTCKYVPLSQSTIPRALPLNRQPIPNIKLSNMALKSVHARDSVGRNQRGMLRNLYSK